jgi:hypothetical protein
MPSTIKGERERMADLAEKDGHETSASLLNGLPYVAAHEDIVVEKYAFVPAGERIRRRGKSMRSRLKRRI